MSTNWSLSPKSLAAFLGEKFPLEVCTEPFALADWMWDKLGLSGPKFCVADMPLPPSANNQYIVRSVRDPKQRTGARGWLAPSRDLEAFKEAFESWRKEHLVLVEKARKFVLDECLMQGKMARVDWYFALSHSSMWTLDGRPKRLDTKNRIKAVQDALADALRIDDMHFWCGYDERVETEKTPRVFAVIRPHRPRGIADLNLGDL